ncbi:hypothetical protein FB451DRAFT_1483119 [Mycena latifolia]|nr:hypothetical protein FB451DRAFT_1483119 [Mycena latifolia]
MRSLLLFAIALAATATPLNTVPALARAADGELAVEETQMVAARHDSGPKQGDAPPWRRGGCTDDAPAWRRDKPGQADTVGHGCTHDAPPWRSSGTRRNAAPASASRRPREHHHYKGAHDIQALPAVRTDQDGRCSFSSNVHDNASPAPQIRRGGTAWPGVHAGRDA